MNNGTFHLFTELPPEIRASIWRHAVEPRIVPITCWTGEQRAEVTTMSEAREDDLAEGCRRAHTDPTAKTELPLELYAKAPLRPPLLDVCKEVLQLGLYEQMILTPGSSASYAWVNYEMDNIYLEDEEEPYSLYRNCGSLVRRLRIRADPSNEYWFYNQSATLKSTFNQLQECFVVMGDEARIWDWRSYDYRKWFSCPPDKIHLIDEENDERMTHEELLQMSNEAVNKWSMSSNRFGSSASADDENS
ncbi:hypothetical protein LEL_09533 [Akanthomyces lecanii RCEF 1005]|uniref:2EXR domain-containing protein n=1 Tax=Akanthomyces lecanii RCEF 1005 TaxID=1081108 RepID=A0A162JM32_CORDF|nr:hypothetical protein LEL_09533 [Akanthomyces lecanii RCEF 1005]